jgi:hypothetical protein
VRLSPSQKLDTGVSHAELWDVPEGAMTCLVYTCRAFAI